MKTISFAILSLSLSSILALPIVLVKHNDLDTRNIAPNGVTDLEARRFIIARDFMGDNGKLSARYFDDDVLEARDVDMLEARDFHDNYLEARDVNDMLEARNFEGNDLEARTSEITNLEHTKPLPEPPRSGFQKFKTNNPNVAGAGQMGLNMAAGSAVGALIPAQFQQNHPKLATIANIGGGLASSLMIGKAFAKRTFPSVGQTGASDGISQKLLSKRGGQYVDDLNSLE